MIVSTLKLVGAPGSYGFLVLCASLGFFLIHVWPRRPVLGRAWLFAVISVYLALATPVAAHHIAEVLRAYTAWPSVRIILYGDDWLLSQLLEGGIPAGQITHDPRPLNTLEQMVAVRDYVRTHPHDATAVIASRLQMPRIAAIVDTMQLHVMLLPSPADVEPPRTGPGLWLPRYTALRISRDAIYEHAALVYYRWKGFTHGR